MLTFRNLLDRAAKREGRTFADLEESQKAVRVDCLNEAIDWSWISDEDSSFMYPCTVGAGTVTVTDGLINSDDLGGGTCAAFFSSDPSLAGAHACPVKVRVTHEGVRPVDSRSTVYAYYRNAAPQGTYAEDSDYATPANIKALYNLGIALQDWNLVNSLKVSDGDPDRQRSALLMGLRRTASLPWSGYQTVLSAPSS